MLDDIFYTKKYDSNILIKNDEKLYSVFNIKQLIKSKCEEIVPKSKNVVICKDDNFSFIINFFASIFTDKTIYLLDSKQKLNNLDFEHTVLNSKILENNSKFEFKKINIHKPNINFYTSGTTSKPKIFQKSIYNLFKEAKDLKEELNLKTENIEFYTTTILQHLFSMTFFLMFPLANIEKKIIINTDKILYPENITEKNSILVSTPAFLDTIKKYDSDFLNSPKYIISAGSKLNSDTFSYLEKYSNITEIFGSTETGVMAYKTNSNDDLTVFKNVKIKITNDKTTIESDYFPEDIIEINDDIELEGNKLKFKKRKDSVLKIYDKRIYSDELEEIINKNEKVSKSYFFKFKNKLACFCALSEIGKDFLIKNGTKELKNDLKKYLKNYFEIIPQKWIFSDILPFNKRGKTNKVLIEKMFNVNFSFPCILDRKISQNEILYKIFFSKDLKFFKGHFPDFPITPGVAQLYFAQFLIENCFDEKFLNPKIKKLKFSNIIKPDSIIFLKLKKTEKNIGFEFFNDNKIYSSGLFLLEDNVRIVNGDIV